MKIFKVQIQIFFYRYSLFKSLLYLLLYSAASSGVVSYLMYGAERGVFWTIAIGSALTATQTHDTLLSI